MTEGRIYQNGWNAAIIRLGADSNPFPVGSSSYKDWHDGWKSGSELTKIRHPRIEHAN
jgi:hypothetical protein